MLYKLYIGANNKTKKLEEKKAVKITGKQFEGFTTYKEKNTEYVKKGLGYWQGKKEKCLILEIETKKKSKIIGLAKELSKKLKQDAIGLAVIGKMSFIAV